MAVSHKAALETEEFLRSKVIFGLNVIKPFGPDNDCTQTEIVSISHVQYTGISPYIVSYSMPFGMYSYMLQLKSIFI